MLPGNALAQVNPVDVEGTCSFSDTPGTFAGELDVTRFAVQNGQLVARGTLSGTCTDASGTVLSTLPDTAVTIPVNLQQTTATCEILDLVLGPLHLDLLGLVVDLDTVDLEITAESGPGNLLGNLLCAITGLLDNPGSPLGGLAALLNRILSILG
jgi:hypothetical protein